MIATYAYNRNGLRKSKTVSGVTTTYNWDASGNLVRETTAGASTYFYWVGGKLVGLKKNGTTYIVHDNLRGDVESITDTSGNIVAQAHYDPWGNRISSSGSLVQPMRYAGYYYDDETGLYYLKSRYFSPVLGRFLTRDSIKYISKSAPNTLNLYSYCGNNPVSLTDPNGNWASEAERKYAQKNWSTKDYNYVNNLGYLYNTDPANKDYYHAQADKVRASYKWSSSSPSSSASGKLGGNEPKTENLVFTAIGLTTGLETKSGNESVDDGMNVVGDIQLTREMVQTVLTRETPGYSLMWKLSTIEFRNDGVYISREYYDALFGPNFGGT